MITLTKIFTFEMAHALLQHDGACANIHGHSYRLEVTVTGKPLNKPQDPKNGMIIDFSDLKKIVNNAVISRFDHALVLNAASNEGLLKTLQQQFPNIVTVNFQPTSENLLLDFVEKINALLPETVLLKRLRLYETATSYAEYICD